MSYTPTELQLKKESVFIAVAEAVLSAAPDSNLRNLVDTVVKPLIPELKNKIRNERIGRTGKGRNNE